MYGPVEVSLFTTSENFARYGGGVFDDALCRRDESGKLREPNHAMVVIGYGAEEVRDGGGDYWVLQNSWGTDWGEDGFIRMRPGKDACRITLYWSYLYPKDDRDKSDPPRPLQFSATCANQDGSLKERGVPGFPAPGMLGLRPSERATDAAPGKAKFVSFCAGFRHGPLGSADLRGVPGEARKLPHRVALQLHPSLLPR